MPRSIDFTYTTSINALKTSCVNQSLACLYFTTWFPVFTCSYSRTLPAAFRPRATCLELRTALRNELGRLILYGMREGERWDSDYKRVRSALVERGIEEKRIGGGSGRSTGKERRKEIGRAGLATSKQGIDDGNLEVKDWAEDKAMLGRRAREQPKEAPSPKYVFSALVQHTTTGTSYTDLRQWALTRAHGSQPGPKIHLAF
ncbi:hypothetical protein BDV93DRAFT_515347 [Ceratobasidium sp. AG-I]|nr:hypothetical protein BDV93DRAFT_515347 [Ceratobasidium sp. AG-I]